jgi:hypothetical protein
LDIARRRDARATLYAVILRDIGKGDDARFKKAASNNNCSGRFTNA